MIVGVCGKGGAGKTTLTALIARSLARRPGLRALLIDADPAGGLASALGLAVPRTLDDVRRELVARATGGDVDARELAASLDYRLGEALVERGNLALLAVGRPEEEGCYCNLNALLREAIEPLAARFDRTVIDAEAGVEQVNRRVLRGIELLLLVADPSARALRVAETIAAVARSASASPRVALVLNRVRPGADAAGARVPTLDLVGAIPEDEMIHRFAAAERSLLDLPDGPVTEAVERIVARLGLA